MFFKDIIGQDKVKERLIKSVRDERISHAQLFSGPEGSGKLALALAYAQYISCRNRTPTDSCGECPSCKKYAVLSHPDLHFVFPIFKKGSSPTYCDDFLKQWREMLHKSPYFSLPQWMEHINSENLQLVIYSHESESIIKKLNLKSFEAEYKTMIIWLPERMNDECANKLLKMIEEPPSKTLFLLITEREADIISTIRSRTQIIKIPKITDNDLQDYLQKSSDFNPETIAEMVHYANGNYLRTIEYFDASEDKQYFFSLFQQLMRTAYVAVKKTDEIGQVMEIADELATLGRERQKEFLQYAMHLTREFFVMNLQNPSLVYLNREEKKWGSKFARFINERNVISLNNLFEKGYLHISRNGNARIIFMDTALAVIRLIRK